VRNPHFKQRAAAPASSSSGIGRSQTHQVGLGSTGSLTYGSEKGPLTEPNERRGSMTPTTPCESRAHTDFTQTDGGARKRRPRRREALPAMVRSRTGPGYPYSAIGVARPHLHGISIPTRRSRAPCPLTRGGGRSWRSRVRQRRHDGRPDGWRGAVQGRASPSFTAVRELCRPRSRRPTCHRPTWSPT
jgi:hypothetical protein